MKFILPLIWLSVLPFTVCLAQKYQKAIVTDVNFLRRSGNYVNGQTFPFYFHHEEFVEDVFSDLRKHLHAHFGIEDIEFLVPDSIFYYENVILPGTRLKQAASRGKPGELFVCVESILQEAFESDGVINYSFVTKIKVLNHRKRKVFQQRNRIPFRILIDGNITGKAEMSENDFYLFYFEGLELAFEGKPKTDIRYIYKPPTDYYHHFMASAEMFSLKTEGKEYSYGTDDKNMIQVLSFNEITGRNGSRELIAESFEYSIKDKYQVINHFSSDTLIVKLPNGYEFVGNELTGKHKVELEIFKKKQKIGSFRRENINHNEGSISSDSFRFVWNEDYYVTEVYVNNNFHFLINQLDGIHIIFVHEEVTEQQLANFFTALFINNYMKALTGTA